MLPSTMGPTACARVRRARGMLASIETFAGPQPSYLPYQMSRGAKARESKTQAHAHACATTSAPSATRPPSPLLPQGSPALLCQNATGRRVPRAARPPGPRPRARPTALCVTPGQPLCPARPHSSLIEKEPFEPFALSHLQDDEVGALGQVLKVLVGTHVACAPMRSVCARAGTASVWTPQRGRSRATGRITCVAHASCATCPL